jgi:hypothetical protein
MKAKIVTITLVYDPERYELTFDTGRISEDQVRKLFTLYHNPSTYVYPGPGFDGNFREHGFLARGKKSIEEAEARLHRLDSLKYPPELKPVFDYVWGFLSFWIWQVKTQYDFYSSWNPKALENKYEERGIVIEPAKGCAQIIALIREAKSKDQQNQLMISGWWNCVTNAWHDAAGPYPEDSWKQFLKEYGIQQRVFMDFD